MQLSFTGHLCPGKNTEILCAHITVIFKCFCFSLNPKRIFSMIIKTKRQFKPMDICPFVVNSSDSEKVQLAKAPVKDLIRSSVKMLVRNCSYFFLIGRQQCFKRLLGNKVF